MAPWRLERSLAEQAGITPWECRDTFPVGTRDAAAWEEFWGSPAIPLMEVWFGFLFQPYLNPAPLSLLFGHSLRMPSKGRRSCPSTGVGIGNKFHVLVLEGASATFRRGVGRESRRRPQPPMPFSLWSVSELGLPVLGWVSQSLRGICGDPTPAEPRLVVPKPFSSACAMWVVTELGPAPTRSFSSAWW